MGQLLSLDIESIILQEVFDSLDEDMRKLVRNEVIDLLYDRVECAFYGIDYVDPDNLRAYEVVMDRYGLLDPLNPS